jgi:hypothetical protein
MNIVCKDKKFNWEQMREIRIAFEIGLNLEQVNFLINKNFHEWQMQEIRIAFQNGFYFPMDFPKPKQIE